MATVDTNSIPEWGIASPADVRAVDCPAFSRRGESPFTLVALFRTYRGRILATYGLLNLENLLNLAQPYCLGQAINGLLHSSHTGVVLFVAQYISHLAVSTLRRFYDTRTFTGIYTDTVVQLVLDQGRNGMSLSRTTACSALSRAYVEFYEQHLPILLQATYCVVGGLLMLGAYDLWLVPLCLLLFVPASPLGVLYRRRTLLLNKHLHDQLEQEVDAIQNGQVDRVRSHYSHVALWRIRLSDCEARNFLTMDMFVLAMMVIVLLRSCGAVHTAAGDIYAVFRYALLFVTGVDTIPYMIQQVSRLQDIGRRLRADK